MSKENIAVQTSFCKSSKNQNKKEFLEKIITEIKKISQSLDKTSVVLSDEIQGLIKNINDNASKLSQLIDDKEFNTQDEKNILSELQGQLKELQPQLKQLPYSNQQFINNLCKAINTLLEKLADFFVNGPIVSEGVYITVPDAKPHHFNFFHPVRPINTPVEDLSEKLSF